MREFEFYLTVLRLMLDKQDSKPAARRWRRRSSRADGRRWASTHEMRPQRSLRKGQTLRAKTRHRKAHVS